MIRRGNRDYSIFLHITHFGMLHWNHLSQFATLCFIEKQKKSNSTSSGALLLLLEILQSLTHCNLVDSSTVICWMSPFVVLGVMIYFVLVILLLTENPVSKHCRP